MNEIGIVLRVNTQEAARLSAAVKDVQTQNRSLERDLQRALKLKETELRLATQMADAQKTLNNQYTFAAAALANEADEIAHSLELQRSRGREAVRAAEERAKIAQQEIVRAEAARKSEAKLAAEQAAERRQWQANATALQQFKIKTIGENIAAEEAANASAKAQLDRRAAWERENAAALRAFKVKSIGEAIDAEITAQARLDRLHAAAIAEDIARERARTNAVVRAREQATAAKAAEARGALSAVGVGSRLLGGPVAAIAYALTTGAAASSRQSVDFERAEQSIAAATGSLAIARAEMQKVEEQADRLGLSVTSTAKTWSQFQAASKGTTLEGGRTRDIFLAVSEAAQKLNLRSEETEGALRALGQMMSKGKVQAEELRGQLGDRLPGAFNIMARALGVSTAQLDKMLQQGEVLAEDALPKFAAELRRTFDTDALTRIDTAASNFTRLANEIKIAASAFGELVNTAASPAAGGIAGFMRDARESARFQQEYGFLDKGFNPAAVGRNDPRYFNANDAAFRKRIEAFYQQTATVYGPTGEGGFDFTAGLIPRPSASEKARLSGADLLSSGVTPLSDKDRKALLTVERQILTVNKALTEEQRFQARLANGEFEGQQRALIDAQRRLAIATDGARAADRATVSKEKLKALSQAQAGYAAELLTSDAAHNEQIKDGIRGQMARNAALQEELNTGARITNVRRRELEALYSIADVTGRSRESEADITEELQKQADLRREARQIAEEALLDASRSSGINLGQSRSHKEIEAETRALIDQENGDYLTKRISLELSGENSQEAERQLYEDHQRKLTEIAMAGEDARVALTRARADIIGGIFGNLANTAQAFGEDGFKAYKAFAIAEATASMISGAVGAFAQASKTYPPPFGQVMGGIAAGAVVASGIAQIAQIRSLSYGGGRELGGGVNERSFYEVGEKGRPELYEQDGKLYMIPGNNGRVTPASSMPAAAVAPAPVVRIENHGEPLNVRMKSLMGNVLTLEAVPAIVDQARVGARSDRMRDLEAVGPETRYRQSREGTRTRPSRRRFA
ncbi:MULTISPECIES: tape measure protein [Hydrocarboniphaga]|uniref:Tape measure protein N-terminal domain-containing protein n=1 Tax=Hydrocarboniphaga effusa AP103 TaxID=1172194 RepID=I8I1C8_9GAMM|nr:MULTISPECIES: tape measure protein [Hydrocarboniphaga]EIT69461.1 hypothetical protein WQQ_30430 [Hydrocarboniphaga effusa AP103]MDZ4078189.1 tape measure protein [Hydrocarboniphaga sp.]